jgi:hypothetical protein
MIRPDIRLLLPRRVDRYEGPRLAFWLLAGCNVVGTVRSLIHLLARTVARRRLRGWT